MRKSVNKMMISMTSRFSGLLTYREKLIFFDPSHSTAKDQQDVATAIAHELAHMWFGKMKTNMH